MATKQELLDSIRALTALLEELHQEEITNFHYGDQPETCSYCIEIERANKLLESET